MLVPALLALALASLTGCDSGERADDARSRADAPGGDSPETAPGDTSVDADSDPSPEDDHGCASIYDGEKLPSYELDFEPGDWAGILADYRTGDKDYHPARFTYEGQAIDVQVRLKGNPNFSWFGDKMQYVISFNEDDPAARFHGLRKVVLDAPWYDPTLLRERLAWSVLRDRGGIAAACANNATLTLNGEYSGIYANLEYFDHEYLERNFGKENAGGGLWKYGTEPKANAEEADAALIDRIWRTTDPAELADIADLQEWVREWAAESVLGDDDGYWCCKHNFYLYEHPTQGVLFLPWDMDDTFEITPYDSDPVEGYGRGLFRQAHFRALMADPTWHAAYVDEVEAMNAAMDPAVLDARVTAWDAQIHEELVSDPQRTFSVDEHDDTVARLRSFLPARHAYVDAWVACQRDPSQDLDGDGLTVCDDNDDTTPVSEEICNGVDDDNNGLVDDAAGCEDCQRHDIDERHLLFCSEPRSFDAAELNCQEAGGTLAIPRDTEEVYLIFFYTWSLYEPWWLGRDDGATCLTWDVESFNYGSEPCGDAHPSVCRLP